MIWNEVIVVRTVDIDPARRRWGGPRVRARRRRRLELNPEIAIAPPRTIPRTEGKGVWGMERR